jgi:hypothetical protein
MNPAARSLPCLVLCLGLGAAIGGCATSLPSFEPKEIYEDAGRRQPGLLVTQVPEGQRVMLIKTPGDVEKVCSPRESDEGLGVSKGFDVSVPTGAGSVGFGEDVGDQAVALAHPTAIVLLARELLYRACELSLNLNADSEQTLAIYERFLRSLESIAPATQTLDEEGDDDDDDDDDDD